MKQHIETSNRAAGIISLLGAGSLASAAAFPWIKVTGPAITIKPLADFKPGLTLTAGGVADGGVQVLVAAIVVALLALLVIGTTRSSNWSCRLCLFVVGAGSATAGGYLIYRARTLVNTAVPDSGNWLLDLAHGFGTQVLRTAVTSQPGTGAYAMAVGGTLVAVGALFPSRNFFPPSVSPPWAQAAFERGSWPGIGDQASSHATQEDVSNSRRPRLVALGVVAAIGLIALMLRSSSESTITIGGASLGEASATSAEKHCVGTATNTDTGYIDSAGSINAKNAESLSRQFAQDDITGCPGAFVSAHGQWVQAWAAYASFLAEANKFHAPWNSEWSSENTKSQAASMLTGLQTADDAMSSAAEGAGVQMGHRTWSATQ